MDEPSDQSTPLEVLKDAIRQFVKQLQWEKYHNPKNLVMSIGIETGELMENFQWLSPANSSRVSKNSKRGQQVIDELSDVIIYCLLLAMAMDIDVTSAVLQKIERNLEKYPPAKYKGRYRRPKTSHKPG